ncbi:MAG: response regulator [Lachnospiraceae bacterium]
MLTYKVLLVDDEEEVMDVIEHKINWGELGFEVIGRAQNGVKAMEVAEKMQPDVVITDIKMPYMDGLELSRNLKKENPSIRIMILTGFDEFEYAKEAVHLEIEEYVLKPVNAKELADCMIRLKEALDKERDEKLNVKKLEQYYMESLSLLQTNFFCSLIEGHVQENDYERFINDYQISLRGPYFCCVVLHTSENHEPQEMSPLLLNMSVQREAREKFGDKWRCVDFTHLGNTIMIVELSSEESISQFTDDCDWFCRWSNRFLGAVVTAGIGKVCNTFREIDTSYEGAREAVSYRVIYGTGRAINISDIAPKGQELSMQLDEIKMNDLFKAIHLGDNKDIENAVILLVNNLRTNAKTVSQYNFAVMEIVGHLYRFCSNNYMNFDDHIGDVKNPYEAVPQMDEKALTTWIIFVSESISEELKNARNSSLRFLITEAKNIVHSSYEDPDLSLDVVCSRLGVSNSYFSSVFKKEVGQSFITYLTDFRMEKALRLILETNEKSYEIAEHVGYVDANYFSYVFKRKYGMSPSKYRSEHIGK